jgi:hypothetical protein
MGLVIVLLHSCSRALGATVELSVGSVINLPPTARGITVE